MPDPLNLPRLRGLLDAATETPWVCEDSDRLVRGPDGRTIARGHLRGTRHQATEALANAALIVAAVNSLPALLDEIEALRAAANEAFDFLGGVDDASAIRGKLLAALNPSLPHTEGGETR